MAIIAVAKMPSPSIPVANVVMFWVRRNEGLAKKDFEVK
tara:strand:+ start:325 stop:441 length:117 start_codon:yes stop_codon:yes gene_type:complete